MILGGAEPRPYGLYHEFIMSNIRTVTSTITSAIPTERCQSPLPKSWNPWSSDFLYSRQFFTPSSCVTNPEVNKTGRTGTAVREGWQGRVDNVVVEATVQSLHAKVCMRGGRNQENTW